MIEDWKQAEVLALGHMRQIGFTDAVMTGPGTDGGVDVRSTEAIAEVKYLKVAVGRPEIQKLHSAMIQEKRSGVFYSLNGYSADAVRLADRLGMSLFRFTQSGRVTAVNESAQKLAKETVVQVTVNEESSTSSSGGGAVVVLVIVVIVGFFCYNQVSSWFDSDDATEANEVHGERSISKEEYKGDGKIWPFTVDEGILRCQGDQVLTFTADDVTYLLEREPALFTDDNGWYDILDIRATEPDSTWQHISLRDVLHDARGTCAKDSPEEKASGKDK